MGERARQAGALAPIEEAGEQALGRPSAELLLVERRPPPPPSPSPASPSPASPSPASPSPASPSPCSAASQEGASPRPGGYDALNVEALACAREPLWGIAALEGTRAVPSALACWTETARARALDGVHFFTEDYRFERVWNAPSRYRARLSRARLLCGPDFSVYRDWPRAANLWNVYRSRWLCALWESWGLAVAPTLSWAGPDTWSFCFLGIPRGVTVAVSTVGAAEDEQARRWFADGYAEAVRRLAPHCVLVYGKSPLPPALEELAPTRSYGTARIEAMKARGLLAGAARASQLRMEGT